MEPDRPTSPPWLPAVRPQSPPPVVPPPAQGSGRLPVDRDPAPPGPPRPFSWRKLTRSRRGAAGLVIAVAALLLWPFSGWSWIPWAAGIAALILLRLLRLDGLLRGWVLHLGGVVVIVGLMCSTGPWAWALAASLGILLAGLAQLPWWRLAAVGAVLCVVSGVGFGIRSVQDARQVAADERITSIENFGQIAEEANRILPVLIQSINGDQPDPDLLCNVLTVDARQSIARIAGTPDCPTATPVLYGRSTSQRGVKTPSLMGPKLDPRLPAPLVLELDGCGTPWSVAAGTASGRIHIQLVNADNRTYAVSGFTSC